ncbi:MAG: tetratricopeptide repeat protein [Cyanobacteriota/Melainabacteria group bacterium]
MPDRYHQSKIATSLFLTMLISIGSGSAEAQDETADSLVRQAMSEAKQQKHIDAIRNYSKAIKLSPEHHPAYFYRARSRKALADYQNAVLDYNYAIKLNPKSSMAYTERGWCLTKLDLPKQAMNDLDQALKLNPKNTRALEYRASLKYKQGDFQGALGDVNQILKLKPNSSKQLAEFMLPRLNLVKKKAGQRKPHFGRYKCKITQEF